MGDDHGHATAIVSAIMSHVIDLRESPIAYEDVIARMLIYTSVLKFAYGLTPEELGKLHQYAMDHEVVSSMKVPSAELRKYGN